MRLPRYAGGYLGVMPVARQYVQDNYKDSIGATPDLARFSAAMMFTPFVSVLSHPPDTIKTCLQGDVEQTTYKGYMQTTQVRRAATATTSAAATTAATATSPPPHLLLLLRRLQLQIKERGIATLWAGFPWRVGRQILCLMLFDKMVVTLHRSSSCTSSNRRRRSERDSSAAPDITASHTVKWHLLRTAPSCLRVRHVFFKISRAAAAPPAVHLRARAGGLSHRDRASAPARRQRPGSHVAALGTGKNYPGRLTWGAFPGHVRKARVWVEAAATLRTAVIGSSAPGGFR